eukprot:gene10594-biopygen15348
MGTESLFPGTLKRHLRACGGAGVARACPSPPRPGGPAEARASRAPRAAAPRSPSTAHSEHGWAGGVAPTRTPPAAPRHPKRRLTERGGAPRVAVAHYKVPTRAVVQHSRNRLTAGSWTRHTAPPPPPSPRAAQNIVYVSTNQGKHRTKRGPAATSIKK